jgi:hypothetical protein
MHAYAYYVQQLEKKEEDQCKIIASNTHVRSVIDPRDPNAIPVLLVAAKKEQKFGGEHARMADGIA